MVREPWGTSCCALGTAWSGLGGMRSSMSSICWRNTADVAGAERQWNFLEEAARMVGVRAIHLEVVCENAAALQVYGKLGFVEHDNTFLSKWIAQDVSKPRGRNAH